MLRGKNVIITGCLQGIGKETVRVFAENGADIFACALRREDEYETYCRSLADQYDVKIHPVYFDFADHKQIKEAVREIRSGKKEIHGLVNIAGINRGAYFCMADYEDMLETFQVNFFSQMLFSQYIVRMMQRTKTAGSIVFTSSVSALDGNSGQLSYAASKAALCGAVRTMALELGSSGIRVNAAAPGVICSPMTEKLPDEIIREKIRTMDIPRPGTAKEAAGLYLFLISDLSFHISGQVLRVDGGIR